MISEVRGTLMNMGVDYEIAFTRRRGHAIEMAHHAAERGFSRILSVGGDGVAGEVLNGSFGSDTELAVVPAGTGNDLAAGLGIPLKPAEATKLALSGTAVSIDVGRVNERYFFQVAGAGFDSLVTKAANDTSWIKGREVYVYATIRTLFGFEAANFSITTPDGRVELKAMMVAVGNGPSYGGGMRVTPDARFDDGVLDVCIVENISIPHFMIMFPRVFNGTHVKSSAVRMLKTKAVRLEADRDFPIYADGEYVSQLPAEITVHPGAISVVAPAYAPAIVPERKPVLAPLVP